VSIATKRIYETAVEDDGWRVLVDRLWPRGVTKTRARIDDWAKDIAPSNELRRWFGHEIVKWPEFVERYRRELESPTARAKLDHLLLQSKDGPVTLVFAAADPDHCNAAALLQFLSEA
jgi:uncharacterized protein YeaO (DUF488 family)